MIMNEDLNPAQPNIRDDAVEKMMRLVFLWFFGLAIATLLVIAFLFLNSVHKKNLERVRKEYAIQKLDAPIDWSQHTNVYYAGDADVIEFSNLLEHSFSLYADEDNRWLWSSVYTNNWHYTNVVFSSTREPVVTKTNGEWRIGFK